MNRRAFMQSLSGALAGLALFRFVGAQGVCDVVEEPEAEGRYAIPPGHHAVITAIGISATDRELVYTVSGYDQVGDRVTEDIRVPVDGTIVPMVAALQGGCVELQRGDPGDLNLGSIALRV